jgi:PadR family transcriptional regulator, regulatory protein PadR
LHQRECEQSDQARIDLGVAYLKSGEAQQAREAFAAVQADSNRPECLQSQPRDLVHLRRTSLDFNIYICRLSAMPRAANTSPQTIALLDVLLSSSRRWRHGYDLAGETGLKSGTLYPLLMRLADQGVLESRWETDDKTRRPRHVYRLSAAGVTLARTQIRNATSQERAPRLRPRKA